MTEDPSESRAGDAREVLGHSATRTTRLCSHLLPEHLEKARDAFNFAPHVSPAALAASKRWGVRETEIIQTRRRDRGQNKEIGT